MITVLTPAYNRAHTLGRLYDSLCHQSDIAFEWLVVDDGSTDETLEVLNKFQCSKQSFPISIIRQENGGKHVALNTGVGAAKGEWIFIVDSDDVLTLDAIAVSRNMIKALPNSGVVGICFRKAHFNGRLIGVSQDFPEDVRVMHPSKAGSFLMGDLAYLFKREVMLALPFPIVKGEKFVPELYIWNQIGDRGEIHYFVNKAIYLCEYLPDGYSQNFSANIRKNCRGFQIFYKAQFFRERTFKGKLKCIVRVVQCEWFALLRAIS